MIGRALSIGLALLLPVFAAQDKASQGEVVEVEVTVSQRPQGTPPSPYLINFTPKEPLKLAGKGVGPNKLRESLEPALKYLLDKQDKDGSWRYDPSQIRADVPKNDRSFQRTAQASVSPAVMTALCCMALRSHEELAPARIKAAIDKGLKFVMDEAPRMDKKDYAIWTWSFSAAYLIEEFGRTKDMGQKQKILEVVKILVDKILKDQRGGKLEVPALPDKTPREKAKDPKPSWTEKLRESQGGSIGVDPAIENEPVGGVLIQKVAPGSPAEKAGIKPGDRIFEIDGHAVNGMGHLLDVIDSIEPGTKVKMKLHRGLPANSGPKVPEDGGWSYYAWAESMSFTTATTVLALLDAKSIGVDVPQGEIDRAVRMLESAQFRHEEMSEDGFLYRLHANKGNGPDIRGAIGRIAVCTLALHKVGEADLGTLTEALDTFVRRRGELDRVRGYPGNHFVRSYANAAYYFLYGHYYSAVALQSVKDAALKKKYGAFIQEALVSIQWKEGTWTDHSAWGELYGTAMAVNALGRLKFVTPEAYKTPLPKLQGK